MQKQNGEIAILNEDNFGFFNKYQIWTVNDTRVENGKIVVLNFSVGPELTSEYLDSLLIT